MEKKIKAFNLLENIYENNSKFRELIDKYMPTGQIRRFNDEEWDKIKSQNFDPNYVPEETRISNNITSFYDMFVAGLNIGSCVNTSELLSYSYNNVSIVSGILPLLRGTINAENGGHRWLETNDSIIDTSLMLIIDKSLKEEFGYIEEGRITPFQLSTNSNYQSRKEFINDPNLNKGKKH